VRTLAAPARIDIEVKRSRFIAHAARVDSESEALDFLAAVADPAATHNCWAWRIGIAYRFNDDGEPAGTAGRPIHAALEGKDVDHAMVVVTRYFGGVKLGAGGLVRAYGGAAARAIDAAGAVTVQAMIECLVEAGFEATGSVHAALEQCGARRLDERFSADGVEIRVEIAETDWPDLCERLRNATRGTARLRRSG